MRLRIPLFRAARALRSGLIDHYFSEVQQPALTTMFE